MCHSILRREAEGGFALNKMIEQLPKAVVTWLRNSLETSYSLMEGELVAVYWVRTLLSSSNQKRPEESRAVTRKDPTIVDVGCLPQPEAVQDKYSVTKIYYCCSYCYN